MTDPTFWNQVFIWPIVNVLLAFYKLFESLQVPGALGLAVIGLTIVIRLILYPLMHAQLKSAKQMQKLKPHMDKLNEKHKGDKKALQQAQLDLYKEHGVNPAAGCLPLLIQMPVLIALYNVFYHVLNNGNIQKVVTELNQVAYASFLHIKTLDLSFFGVNLGIKPGEWQTHGAWLLAVPVITGGLQWWQSKLMMASQHSQEANGTQQASGSKKPDANSKKQALQKTEEKKPEDTAAEMQKQMMMITPIMFGYFALQFPLGLALYWNVFGLFGIMQQLQINKEHK